MTARANANPGSTCEPRAAGDSRTRLRLKSVRAVLAGGLTAALLCACASPPQQGTPGQILSRLPAANSAPAPLSDAEKARYRQIDKQVMADQDARARSRAWADAWAATPVYYSGYGYYSAPYPVYQTYPAAYPAYPALYPQPYPFGPAW